MLKIALRVFSTSIVVVGAITLAHFATPQVDPVVPPAGGPPASGALASAWHAVGEPRGAAGAVNASVVPALHAPTRVALVNPGRVEPPPASRVGGAASGPDFARRDTYFPSDRIPGDPWTRPDWLPISADIDALASMDGEGLAKGPTGLRSRSVFVYDVDRERVLYTRAADWIRPVASITKLVSSLALMSSNPDLDREICIGAEQYPTRSGAMSHLSTGDCIHGWDALGAALVASDNRGAYALAAAAGMGVDDFIVRMNQVAADLGMDHSTWADPSGLEDENLSTARDIARATLAVASHPLLSGVASAPMWDLHRTNKQAPRRLFSTDHLAGREDIVIHAAKTGYTDTARYCFTTMLETEHGQRLVITLLGAEGKLSRWADVQRVLDWTAGLDGTL